MSYYRQGPRGFGGGPPIGVQVPRMTPVVQKLIIANVAVYLLQFVVGGGGAGASIVERLFGVVPAAVVGLGSGCGVPVPFAPWQVASYMFLHGGTMHLAFNMLILWLFGSELESHWGGRGFARFYVVCGIGAGVAATLMGLAFGSACGHTIGASGAIYGLIMAFGIVFAQRTVIFMLIFPMQARTMAWILFAMAFLATWQPQGGGVSHVAHLGGAVTGWLFLNRAWRIGELVRNLKWKVRRRRFKMVPPDDPDDRWLN